ncbi:hypothetical protein C8T65DRAFT_746113 [Cerioporus squamosus]|nr:hypothetical protein C8T65DRAFT_746113 [Cerioporus squamosus]
MSTDYQYERLPKSDEKRRIPRQEPMSDVRGLHRRFEQDPRLNPTDPKVAMHGRGTSSSPVITEKLEEGRTRVQGAARTFR